MIPSSLLAIFAATLAIGSPVPGISEAVKTLDQPGPLYVNNVVVVEDATRKSPLPILPTGEPVQSSGPSNGQYGMLRSHVSVATADTAKLKRRDFRADIGYCSRELDYKSGQCIKMINATPYRWRKGYYHSYRVNAWGDRWPEYIEPGESIAVLARPTNNGLFDSFEDSAAEVAYHIEGTGKPMSFMLEFRSGNPHYPWIRLLDDLEVMNHHKGAEFNLGARISPFRACHGALRDGTWWGTLGEWFDELIEQTNQFNEDYPGELIIWDFHPTEAFRYGGRWGGKGKGGNEWTFEERDYGYLSGEGRAEFLESLKALNHRVVLPEDVDITKVPLNKFINSKDKKPAVIIRVDERWLWDMDPEDWPGPSEGFVTNREFPMTSTWSEKERIEDVAEHQLRRLDEVEVSRTSQVYDMQWLQTLVGIDAIWPLGVSLISMANEAWDAALKDLFNALTPDRYPNWLTVDAIKNSELKTLVMAMNHCFVLDRCGDWVNERR
ncbi:unnamed protein product [Clonostachys rosea f. rosea IK726]|uniref:Uncharacterized protein n=1 Tax=Clonostachys rosea f. rosea IK726 TaxID=1349383 RepID=A0ACA9TR85_BIOOC|nr:unnamed protein product [Clonostachys rosea f. rosea IK726]